MGSAVDIRKAKIVFFIGKGRLGNQVIQLAALRRLFPLARLRLMTSPSLPNIFESIDGVEWAPSKLFKYAVWRKLVAASLRGFSKGVHIFGYLTEGKRFYGGKLNYIGDPVLFDGLLPIVFAEKIYFQNTCDLLSPEDFDFLRLKKSLLDSCSFALSGLGIVCAQAIIVHVRRGDYVNYTSFGLSEIVLGSNYYRKAIGEMIERSGIKKLLFVTDDEGWCRKEFSDMGDLAIISMSEQIDFAILCQAHYLVCANSTYSLAAALIGQNKPLTCLPIFWLGYNERAWAPPKLKINDKRFIYID